MAVEIEGSLEPILTWIEAADRRQRRGLTDRGSDFTRSKFGTSEIKRPFWRAVFYVQGKGP